MNQFEVPYRYRLRVWQEFVTLFSRPEYLILYSILCYQTIYLVLCNVVLLHARLVESEYKSL